MLWRGSERRLRGQIMGEICNDCGRSVRLGSGWFINCVPDLNEPEERDTQRASEEDD